MEFQYLFGPSGGLGYHLTAWRFHRRLWQPFQQSLNRWLIDDWAPQEKELIIFGSSAGWNLSPEFLRRFDRIVTVDPDHFALWLFQKRFGKLKPGLKIETVTRPEILPWFSANENEFSEFLAGYPHAAILFSNLIGQIGLFPNNRFRSVEKSREVFLSNLKARNWASYHDAVSSSAPPQTERPIAFEKGQASPERFANHFFPDGSQVIDHDTEWLSQGFRGKAVMWSLSPHHHHTISMLTDDARASKANSPGQSGI